jgi:hypothetical protein
VEEDIRDAAVKSNMGLVVFRSFDAIAMHKWVAAKKLANPAQIGLLSLDVPKRRMQDESIVPFAFKITTIPSAQEFSFSGQTPTLYLQGSGAKVSLDAITPTESDITRQSCLITKLSALRYKGCDDYLFGVSRHVAGEVVRWVVGVLG